MDSSSTDKKDAFNPFSTGPRNCIGRNLAYLEMCLVMAKLLCAFDVDGVVEGGDYKWEEQKAYIL